MSTIKANTIENVSGTESHDVAAMGIVNGTSGSSSYIKFPDGTLICHGYLYSNTELEYETLYAHAFLVGTQPAITMSKKHHVSQVGESVDVAWNSTLPSNEAIAVVQEAMSIESNYIAIGRWK